ncbi:MFS transporter [Sphingomonas sp. TX0543]|uniref:MFS transporter n=1 Tax=unclassified Sphingomonas TaxID=196159 RepID=UPI0010FA50EB|nr:MFS transporter [Sphingomonas sp. 3P27F8]
MSNAACLSAGQMGWRQVVAVTVAVLLNALDGFDVLAITFAAPVIAREWGIDNIALGAAISAGLVGMTIGSLLLAPAGDRLGRRPLVLFCVAIMGAGMMLTATATTVTMLCVWRVVTGIGIGGMLAAINAVVAEFSNERRRDFAIALMTVGYPIGGLVGGFASAALVADGWQAIFIAGGALTLIMLPVVWLAMPESIALLEQRGRPGDRDLAERLMRRLGHEPSREVVTPKPVARLATIELFAARHRALTLCLIVSYFLHIVTFYFFSGWLPKLMTDLGFATPDAIRTSAIMSIGGVIGGSLLGWSAPRFGLGRLVPLVMVGTTITMATFAQLSTLAALQIAAFATGTCVFAGIVGLYALLARGFPPDLRVTGTGVVVGFGRGGAIVGPVIGGFLLQSGVSLGTCITVVGLLSLGAAIAVRGAVARV